MSVIEDLANQIKSQLDRLGKSNAIVASPAIVMIVIDGDIFYCDAHWVLNELRQIESNDGAIDLVRKAVGTSRLKIVIE